MQTDKLALEALLLSRTYLYELFHKAFGGEPSGDLLDTLCQQATIDAVEEYQADNKTMASLVVFLTRRLPGQLAQEGFLERVRDEYARVFMGFDHKAVAPCESVYMSADKIYFTARTLAVREAYRQQNLLPTRYPRVPDDHIALEAGFMAVLAQKSTEALRSAAYPTLERWLFQQQNFLTAHLCQWVPLLAQEVRKTKTAILYPQLVTGMEAFVQLDLNFLAEARTWVEEACQESTEQTGLTKHKNDQAGQGSQNSQDGQADAGLLSVGPVKDNQVDFQPFERALQILCAMQLKHSEDNSFKRIEQ